MSFNSAWTGFKSMILVLEKVNVLAARLDDACTKLELLTDRVNEIRVVQATLENEQKHFDSKIGAAAILATDRLNSELLDRISDLEMRLDEVQLKRNTSHAALLGPAEARRTVRAKRKGNERR